VKAFFLIVYGVLALIAIYRHTGKAHPDPEQEQAPEPQQALNVLDCLKAVDDLTDTANRYRQIDTVLTDLECINSEAVKNIVLNVPALTGNNTQYNFICGDDQSAERFREIAEAERLRLIDQLTEQAQRLSDLIGE